MDQLDSKPKVYLTYAAGITNWHSWARYIAEEVLTDLTEFQTGSFIRVFLKNPAMDYSKIGRMSFNEYVAGIDPEL